MGAELLKTYVLKFDLNQNQFQNKILEKNKNLFFAQSFSKNQIYSDQLIFIFLKNRLLPSTFLLNLIEKNTKNIILLNSRKQAIDFTYGKDFNIHNLNLKITFEDGKYCLIIYNDMILGIAEKKGIILKNTFNIGEYLKEN